MSLAETPLASACPACAAAPAAEDLAPRTAEAARPGNMQLALPTIHCAACISGVERGLAGTPGVRSARVNLTLKRVAVETDPGVPVEDIVARLEALGYEAHELDSSALAVTDTDRRGRDLLMRLAVAFFANMNVMLTSVAVWSGADGVTRAMLQ